MSKLDGAANFAFLRNGKLFFSREEAIEGLKKAAESHNQDGMIILSRYTEDGYVKTLFGVLYSKDDTRTITVFDSDSETIVLGDNKSNETINDDRLKFYEELNKLCAALT